MFSNQKLDTLISDDEKERLFNVASEVMTSKVDIKAFLAIYVKRKQVFLGEKVDEEFATLTLVFEKNQEQKWTQIGIKENLILSLKTLFY